VGRLHHPLDRLDLNGHDDVFSSEQRDDYLNMVEVNLLGAITATEVFLDQLRSGGGDLINISSVAGRTARATNGVSHRNRAYGERAPSTIARPLLHITAHPSVLIGWQFSPRNTVRG